VKFTFQNGDQPLRGYTIKRGAGQGGFGEVYYAVSDAGREVALKFIKEHHEIELRGVQQCMNLRNPHLVTIFDVRENEHGQPFVIMEYISGPNLRELVDGSEGPLGEAEAAFFIKELADPVDYLHDRGVVHRDLKPSNIFLEEGHVKVGDYGLSKFISVSKGSGMTMAVGSVHYMAPEVGSGTYTKAIDIYGLGIILYEMLTGKVPFDGESMGEILMKHLTAEPDLADLEEPFRSTVARALAKNPDERPESVREMASALLADSRVRGLLKDEGPSVGEPSSVTFRVIDEGESARPHGELPSLGESAQRVRSAVLQVLSWCLPTWTAKILVQGVRNGVLLVRKEVAKARRAVAERRRKRLEGVERFRLSEAGVHWPLRVLQALLLSVCLGIAGGILVGGPNWHAQWSMYLSLSILAFVMGILTVKGLASTANLTQPWAVRVLAVGICAPLLLCTGPICARLVNPMGWRSSPTAFLFEYHLPFFLLLALLLNWYARYRVSRRARLSLTKTATAAAVGALLATAGDVNLVAVGAYVAAAISVIVQMVSPNYDEATTREEGGRDILRQPPHPTGFLAGLGLFLILVAAAFTATMLPGSSPSVLFIAAGLLLVLIPLGLPKRARREHTVWLLRVALVVCLVFLAARSTEWFAVTGRWTVLPDALWMPGLNSLPSTRLALAGKMAILFGLGGLVILLWPRRQHTHVHGPEGTGQSVEEER